MIWHGLKRLVSDGHVVASRVDMDGLVRDDVAWGGAARLVGTSKGLVRHDTVRIVTSDGTEME